MNSKLKRSIKNAFDVPLPDNNKKELFLQTLPQTKISLPQFVISQILYMRKWTLMLSVLLMLPALVGAYHINKNTLWIASSFVPFLGLLAVSESMRSAQYGMREFEMTTRFSLKSIVLARLSFIGLIDLIILCTITPLCCIGNDFLLFQTGIYLFVPYLLTVTICLWITRHFHGKENIYGCIGISILISGANGGGYYANAIIYQNIFMGAWLLVFIILICRIAQEIYFVVKQTEELVWN